MVISADDYRAASPAELPPAPKQKQSRRGNVGEKFLRGPVPIPWLAAAHRQCKSAMGIAIALWLEIGMRGNREPIRVTRKIRRHMGLSNDQAQRGIHALAAAGLLRVCKGGRGRCAIVEIVASRASKPAPDSDDSNP